MDIKKLQALVIDALEDVKAQEILLFDTQHLTALFDRLAIASGTSNRQTKALAASVRDKVKQAGGQVVSMEGEDTGEWVLVDLGDMVVHIMQPAIRAYYRLEEIWGDKPIKLADAKKGLKAKAENGEAKPRRRRAAAEEPEQVEAAAPKRARKTAAKTAGDEAKSTTKASKSAAKGAAKTTTARKSAAKKTPAGKTVKVAASKSATAGKAPARRATATSR